MEVLERIRPQVEHRLDKESFEGVYESAFPPVAKFVSMMKGTFEDAKDIFHDALVLFYEKKANENFTPISVEAYILGIAKHLWVKKFKHDHRFVSMDDNEAAIAIPADFREKPDANKLLALLEKAGKKCLDLLSAFYYEKLPIKDITKALGYRNDHSTTVQKFKCLEKIRDTVKEKTMNYEDFLE